MPKAKPNTKQQSVTSLEKHPWRKCPLGQSPREGTTVSTYTRKDGTVVRGHYRKDTCADNPSGKDQLYRQEIQKIAEKHFSAFKMKPLGILSDFKKRGNDYDYLIRGWTQYWNDILKPSQPLDPDIVKALIASESSFNSKEWNKRTGPKRARGLMQVTDETLRFLTDEHRELKDHFVNLTEDDMLDPNLSICAGIRWLFRKKELAEARLKRLLTWRKVIAEYKGLTFILETKRGKEIMKKFDKYFSELKRKGGK